MPRLAACSRIASTIIVSVCGVLNIHAFFADIGSMIRADEASEITGVSPSAITSIIASVFGVVVEPMIASTLFSLMSFRVLTTAALESLASSSTMYSTDLPAIVFGRSAIVFFSGMPSETAGPGRRQRDADLDLRQGGERHRGGEREGEQRRRAERRIMAMSPGGDGWSWSSGIGDGEQADVAAKARASCPHRRGGEPVVGKAREEAADRDAALEPRQAHADALVDARAEGDVAVRLRRDVEPVGLGELRRDRGWPRRCRASPGCAAPARRRRSRSRRS